MKVNNKLKGRKVIGGAVLIILATVVALSETMEADLFSKWGDFVIFMYFGYVLGNVGEKYAYKAIDSKNNHFNEKNKGNNNTL